MVLSTALTASLNAGTNATAEAPDGSLATISDISRYCAACWRNARLHPDSWTDCTQEVFCRILERVSPQRWPRMLKIEGEDRREFLRAIDAVKKRTQRKRSHSSYPIDAVADRDEIHETRLAEERDVVRQASAEMLSSRQQEIMRLSLEGWSVHEIADKLAIGAERVSDEKYKAIRKLRERLCAATEEAG
jgi:RNA polymerase sigma factor (sigma-70 family)